MKTKNFRLSIIALSLFAFSSCKKDNNITDNFSPLTAGSTWTYQNTPGTPYTLTATNRDTLIGTRSYKVLTNSAGSNNYLAQDGDNYYRYGVVAAVGSTGLEELYLKDNESVNGIWTATQPVTVPGYPALTANLSYSVKEKGTTRTVNQKSFSNVIHVRLDITISGLPIGGGDFYYAEGVGLIENAIAISVPGQPAINQTQILTSYTIK